MADKPRKRSLKTPPLDRRLSSPEILVNKELAERPPRYHPEKKALDSLSRGLYLRELESRRRAYQTGNQAALFDALFWCRKRDWDSFGMPAPGPPDTQGPVEVVHSLCEDHWMEIPVWVWVGVAEAVKSNLNTATTGGRGRGARWLQRWRQDMIDYARWEAVKKLREEGVKFTDGESFGEVWKRAAKSLVGTAARGRIDAVKKSYSRVEARLKHEPFRYKLFSHIAVRNLAISPPPR